MFLFFWAERYTTVYPTVITESLVVGYLGCLPFLAIVTRAAMNRDEQLSLWYLWAPLGTCPEVPQLSHMAVVFLAS